MSDISGTAAGHAGGHGALRCDAYTARTVVYGITGATPADLTSRGRTVRLVTRAAYSSLRKSNRVTKETP